MDNNIVSSLAWVSRGFAKRVPKEYVMEEEDVSEMKQQKLVQQNLDRDLNDLQEEEDSDEAMPQFTSELERLKNQNPKENDNYPQEIAELSDDEKEDVQIKPTDALVIAAKIENEFSSLEIYVYEEHSSNLFVHHEIALSAFPLDVKWLGIDLKSFDAEITTPGNLAIVSSFLPEIEIWDLDVNNAIEPLLILGGEKEQDSKKVKKFKNKAKQFKPGSHQDSVLSLDLNRFRKNIMSSGSADHTVKLWDLSKGTNVHTYEHHKHTVQVVTWNPKDEPILLTGGYDKQLSMFDVRTPQQALSCTLKSDIEHAIWDPNNTVNIILCTEDGFISQIDARKFSLDYTLHFKAHEKQTTSVSMSTGIPGMMASTSQDHSVKIWDLQKVVKEQTPLCVCSKNPKSGKLFCGNFYADSPWVFACGNSKGEIFIWDTQEDIKVVEAFGPKVDQKIRPLPENCTKGVSGPANQANYEEDDEGFDEEMDQEN